MKMRSLLFVSIAGAALLLAGCGGGSGGGGSPAPAATAPAGVATSASAGCGGSSGPGPVAMSGNAAPVIVDGGTDGCAVNEPFVTVTVCQPGTATCAAIDHVLLDTGSSGLRVLASALGTVQLPDVGAPAGATLAECPNFASGYSWGPVRRADVKIAGETASAIPVQVVNDPAYATVPSGCRNTGHNMGVGASANGILGVGLLVQDCSFSSADCAANPLNGVYFACATPSQCSPSTAPLSSQVANPAALFASDNNGIAITLPAVAAPGATDVAGTLTFGIGTQGNNGLGTATVYTPDTSGFVQTTYNTAHLPSFFDSGSNGNFFSDSSIPPCSNGSGFYCPTTTLQLQAGVSGTNGTTGTIAFTVESINLVTGKMTAAPIAGSAFQQGTFDWGLPFFFGRTVYVAFTGASTPAGAGPYWAF